MRAEGFLRHPIVRFLFDAAQALPEKVAIVSPSRSVTYAQLRDEALASAECLRELGIRFDPVGSMLLPALAWVSGLLLTTASLALALIGL